MDKHAYNITCVVPVAVLFVLGFYIHEQTTAYSSNYQADQYCFSNHASITVAPMGSLAMIGLQIIAHRADKDILHLGDQPHTMCSLQKRFCWHTAVIHGKHFQW